MTTGVQNPVEVIDRLAADIRKTFDDKMGELGAWKAKHDQSLAETGKATEEQKTALAAISEDVKNINAKIADMLQKAARAGRDEPAAMSIGRQLVSSEQFAAYKAGGFKGQTGAVPLVLNALITTGDGAGAIATKERLEGIKAPPGLALTVRDLIAPGTTQSSAVTYIRESRFDSKAAGVKEGVKKPESSLTFVEDTAIVKTLAHWIPVSKQVLEDVAQLQSYIDARMLYGLKLVEDDQLLNGDGTGANLKGLFAYATDFDTSVSSGASTTVLDRIADAILQVRLTGFPANGIYMHPADVNDLRKMKDTTGRYMFADPASSALPMPWGMRVVESISVAKGTALVGAFSLAAQIFDRQTATVEMSDQDQDNFVKNTITIRAEERLALAVYFPSAIVNLPLVGTAGGGGA